MTAEVAGEDPCPCCGGTGVGEWINHYPTEAGQEAVRCVPCDGVGALSPDYRAGYAQAAWDIAVAKLDDNSEATKRIFSILDRRGRVEKLLVALKKIAAFDAPSRGKREIALKTIAVQALMSWEIDSSAPTL